MEKNKRRVLLSDSNCNIMKKERKLVKNGMSKALQGCKKATKWN